MQMLVFITKQTECINPILADLLNRNISGATVIDCEGMLKAINESSIRSPAGIRFAKALYQSRSGNGKDAYDNTEG